MQTSPRTFEDKPATRERVPLLVGITSVSGAGKTYSALRLATGIQRVTGGEIFGIDTEARRMLHYADRFKFRHVDFRAPFGPLDYLGAIEHAVAQGAKVIVVDSMTHEHNGVGGVMDQVDEWLNDRAGDDEGKRKRMFMLAQVKPKTQRKLLNARIVQLGVNAIFCYRAADKVKPVPGKEPEKLGWQAETTSPLFYEMTARFLLMPGADGKVTVNPEHEAEKLTVKLPEQFRGWFKDGMQLDEALGQRLAEWAAGTPAASTADPSWLPLALSSLEVAPDLARLRSAYEQALKAHQWTPQEKRQLADAKDARKNELETRQPGED
jgi:hypothetical protein